MLKTFSKHFLITLTIFLSGFSFSYAGSVSVTPLIIDHTTEARDILSDSITIKNNHSTHLRAYASVHEIELDGNNEIKAFVPASMSDRTESITSWIEISRARIDLQPGEEKVLPLTIRINPNAKSGEYHAYIGFGIGPNQDEAEKKVMENQAAGVIIRVSINDKQVELLRLNGFKAKPLVLENTDSNFTFTLENLGELPQTPSGEIIIYDSRGNELTSVQVNKENKSIGPNEKVEFSAPIPEIDRFGKNKAYLSLTYGNENLASLYDINFYYSIPKLHLIVILTVLIIIPLLLTLALRRLIRPSNYYITSNDEAVEVPLFVRKHHEHEEYEHDINLKKNDT